MRKFEVTSIDSVSYELTEDHQNDILKTAQPECERLYNEHTGQGYVSGVSFSEDMQISGIHYMPGNSQYGGTGWTNSNTRTTEFTVWFNMALGQAEAKEIFREAEYYLRLIKENDESFAKELNESFAKELNKGA